MTNHPSRKQAMTLGAAVRPHTLTDGEPAMSVYIPRGGTLKAVKHEPGPNGSAPYWVIHDDHGEYDGPYATLGDAMAVIRSHDEWIATNQRKA